MVHKITTPQKSPYPAMRVGQQGFLQQSLLGIFRVTMEQNILFYFLWGHVLILYSYYFHCFFSYVQIHVIHRARFYKTQLKCHLFLKFPIITQLLGVLFFFFFSSYGNLYILLSQHLSPSEVTIHLKVIPIWKISLSECRPGGMW